ncbi:MAG: glycoside hydrolase family 38 C-terminal domain-containing protein [Sulfolobales archaeon]
MLRYRQSEIHRRILDLLGVSVKSVKNIDRWLFLNRGAEVELPLALRARPDDELIFSSKIYLEVSPRYRWVFKASISGGGVIKIDGRIHQGLDPWHSISFIPHGQHEITIQATSRALFGENPWIFNFNYSLAALVNWRGISLGLGMLEALRASRILEGSVRDEILQTLSKALEPIDAVPGIAQIAAVEAIFRDLGEPLATRWDRGYIASVYGPGVLRGSLRDIPDIEDRDLDRAIDEAHKIFVEGLEELVKRYPKEGEIVALGHCHIDLAWLWPYSETRRKVIRSFSNVLRLMRDGYSFSYVQSSAQYYAWAEDSQEIFEGIKELVEKGLWIPVGGMWCESDTNLVTGESLARHLLYGQLYFLERFGRISRIGWLPDTFGFSAQLPQIMRLAGIEVFVTHKIMWSDTNRFPYHLFLWEGIDGSKIPVHVIITTYNGSLSSDEVKRVWDEYRQKDLAPAVHAFGVGDGGGGPSIIMLERIDWINRMPRLPRILHRVGEAEYIELIREASKKAPTWRGELYVEIHRGTYTTNHRIKDLVYRIEECLRTAELWSTIAPSMGLTTYPRDRLRGAWETLLRAEFHDVLPGSASYDAYLEAYKELEDALKTCSEISEKAMVAIAGGDREGYIAVFNSLPWSRRAVIELPRGLYRYAGGSTLAHQDLGGSVLVEVEIPATGYVILERAGLEPPKGGDGVIAYRGEEGYILDNGLLRVVISGDGSIRVKDLELGFEISHILRAHRDKPGDWDAWDIERSSIEDPGVALKPSGEPSIVYSGSLKACGRIGYSYKGSEIIQRICLSKGSRVVEISSKIKWISRGYLLKAWLKPSFSFENIFYEIPFGAIRRSSKPRDSWDMAKFEAPALRWADISDGSKGFAVISMTRHGYSPRGDEVGLTLAKTPVFPDPYSGLDEFEARYYIYTHRGGYVDGEVPRIAYELWSPPRVVRAGGGNPQASYISLSGGGAIIESVKISEKGEGYVLRIYNPYDRDIKARIDLWIPFEAYQCDLLERPQGEPIPARNSLEIPLRPFEIKTLLLKPMQK